jgi:hypothetical protein
MAAADGSAIILKIEISQKFSGFENLSFVGDTTGLSIVKIVVIFSDTCSLNKFCQTTRYSGMLSSNLSTKICLTPHNLMIYMI